MKRECWRVGKQAQLHRISVPAERPRRVLTCMYRCTAAFGFNAVSRAGLDTTVPAPRDMASSLAPLFVVEGGSLSGSSRTPLLPAI